MIPLKEFQSAVKPDWCPGCGDYGVLNALQRALAANAKRQPAYLEFICSQHPVYGGWVRDARGGH